MTRRVITPMAVGLAMAGALAGALVLSQAGCAAVARIGEATGVVTPEQAQAIEKTGQSMGKALEQITPEQEYYVGRAVGATLVSGFKVYNNDAATRYVNLVGQTLAMASDKPETFGGYHLLLLDSPDINAFAAPGGLIFISRGMLRLCRSEDELASVLAHEVAHVNLGHAIGAISNARWTQAFTVLAAESGKSLGGEQVAQLTTAFEGSIGDITTKLVTSGYARGQERASDALAVKIVQRVGYDPTALARVLGNMERHLKPGGHDFVQTHPPPQDRISDLNKLKLPAPGRAASAERASRFAASMKGV